MRTIIEEIAKYGFVNDNVLKHLGFDPDTFINQADKAVLFKIGNVSKYFFEISEQEKWDLFTDFPNCAPPFDNIIFEYPMPMFSNSNGKIILFPNHEGISTIGMHLISKKVNTGIGFYWQFNVIQYMLSDRGVIAIPAIYPMGVDMHGKLLNNNNITCIMAPGKLGNDNALIAKDSIEWAIKPVLLALSFLHCKNINIIESLPEKHHGHGQKAKNSSKIKHYTLQIDAVKNILQTNGNVQNNGLKRALHICRGHFKEFSPDKPLFGKYCGTFWWNDQTRGSIKSGLIDKDYEISAGRAI